MATMYTPVLEQHVKAFEEVMPGCMPATGGLQTTVAEAMAYACAQGGKRIRPVRRAAHCRLAGGFSPRTAALESPSLSRLRIRQARAFPRSAPAAACRSRDRKRQDRTEGHT